jgi:hypothetical protein
MPGTVHARCARFATSITTGGISNAGVIVTTAANVIDPTWVGTTRERISAGMVDRHTVDAPDHDAEGENFRSAYSEDYGFLPVDMPRGSRIHFDVPES